LVDHNRLKSITLNKANAEGIRVQRFKMKGNIELASRAILSVNQCTNSLNIGFDILLGMYNGKDLQESLADSIPRRKLKQSNESAFEEQDEQYQDPSDN